MRDVVLSLLCDKYAAISDLYIMHPVGICAIGKRDEKVAAIVKDIDRSAVDLPRAPPTMDNNAEAQQPIGKSPRHPVRHPAVHTRHPLRYWHDTFPDVCC